MPPTPSPSSPDDLPSLSPGQRRLALQWCAKEDLVTIARRCFGRQKDGNPITAQSLEVKAVKAFLAGEGKDTTMTPATPPPTEDVELTEDQKGAIETLAPRMPNSLELTRTVFNDQSIKSLSKKHRVVMQHAKTVYPEGFNTSDEPVDEREWKAPATMAVLIGLVNSFVLQADNRKTYNQATLKPSEEKALKQLMINLRTYRLGYIASQYERKVDRDLFLSTFIRWTHSKSDLTEMEVDQMISAAAETVTVAQLEREIQDIKRYHEQIINGEETDETSGKKKRFGMTEIEQINGVRTKHDSSKKRLESLMEKLETARSERLEKRDDRFKSVVDLLDIWMKDKERRDNWIKAGVEEKEQDKAEVERLSGLEDMIALISGQSKEEAEQ